MVTVYESDADRLGLLALGGGESAATVTDLPSGSATAPVLPGDALTLCNDAGMRRHIIAAPLARHSDAPLHRGGTSFGKIEPPEDASPAYLGFNLFMNAIARATHPWEDLRNEVAHLHRRADAKSARCRPS